MELYKIVKRGIFAENRQGIFFYKFKDMRKIEIKSGVYPYSSWRIIINNSDTEITFENRNNCEEEYKNILNAWINFQNDDNIDEKLVSLLRHIEVMPGSEEYQNAEKRFSK